MQKGLTMKLVGRCRSRCCSPHGRMAQTEPARDRRCGKPASMRGKLRSATVSAGRRHSSEKIQQSERSGEQGRPGPRPQDQSICRGC